MGDSVRPTDGDAATPQLDQADSVTTNPARSQSVTGGVGRQSRTGYERGWLRGYGDLLRDQW
jgi:hypothetical protein